MLACILILFPTWIFAVSMPQSSNLIGKVDIFRRAPQNENPIVVLQNEIDALRSLLKQVLSESESDELENEIEDIQNKLIAFVNKGSATKEELVALQEQIISVKKKIDSAIDEGNVNDNQQQGKVQVQAQVQGDNEKNELKERLQIEIDELTSSLQILIDDEGNSGSLQEIAKSFSDIQALLDKINGNGNLNDVKIIEDEIASVKLDIENADASGKVAAGGGNEENNNRDAAGGGKQETAGGGNEENNNRDAAGGEEINNPDDTQEQLNLILSKIAILEEGTAVISQTCAQLASCLAQANESDLCANIKAQATLCKEEKNVNEPICIDISTCGEATATSGGKQQVDLTESISSSAEVSATAIADVNDTGDNQQEAFTGSLSSGAEVSATPIANIDDAPALQAADTGVTVDVVDPSALPNNAIEISAKLFFSFGIVVLLL
jgi:hypothetical protein